MPADKTCTKCRRSHPASEFHRQTRSPDGLNPWCKECYRQWHRQRYTPQIPVDLEAPRTCRFCGLSYLPVQRRPSEYCSRECKGKARHRARQAAINAAKPERGCLWCGSAIAKTRRADAAYCSESCNSAAHNVTRKMSKRAGRPSRDGDLVSRDAIAQRDAYRCGLCAQPVDMSLRHPRPLAPSIDHVVPLAHGGTNDLSNLQLAHLRCNLAKRAG